MAKLARCLEEQKNYTEAEKLYQKILSARSQWLAAEHPKLSDQMVNLGRLMMADNRLTDSEAMLQKALPLQKKMLPDGHPKIGITQSLLGANLSQQMKFDQAEPLLLEGHKLLSEATDAHPEDLRNARQRIVEMYQKWGKKKEADKWRIQQ